MALGACGLPRSVKSEVGRLTGDDLEALHAIVAKYGYEKHEFYGHLYYVWSADNTILEPSVSLWIIRAPMSGLGEWPKKFAMPFDEKIQAWFESEVADGYYGDPDMYRKKQA